MKFGSEAEGGEKEGGWKDDREVERKRGTKGEEERYYTFSALLAASIPVRATLANDWSCW
jgi:hypothetical protein